MNKLVNKNKKRKRVKTGPGIINDLIVETHDHLPKPNSTEEKKRFDSKKENAFRSKHPLLKKTSCRQQVLHDGFFLQFFLLTCCLEILYSPTRVLRFSGAATYQVPFCSHSWRLRETDTEENEVVVA
jgi:hypothetical protein